MFKRRRTPRLARDKRFLDKTRRRVARKAAIKRVVHRRIKQVTMRFEDAHNEDND
ncbi:hypothetical protein J1N51_06075 [Psychrosphaera ytuae]|uniref:Uncharacterized protein n=1 Tax=Psychrosphaera ytuae TaxID=2820710 RepID=A0A975HJ70_9GAMM|nr:hypothetical protein [Psychrosphaera ytuae]QTH65010.1 hypothetical protein J1N51_06075 [Psychrosphaera ytuae]